VLVFSIPLTTGEVVTVLVGAIVLWLVLELLTAPAEAVPDDAPLPVAPG
jgi:hypothetical protein